MPAIQWRLKVGIIRVAIIPANKGGAAKNAGQICASDVQRTIIRRAGGENDRVIQGLKLVDVDIFADGHIADKPDIVGQGDLFITPRHRLDRLMIGGDTKTDEAKGNGQAVDDIHPHIVAKFLLRGFGCVISRRTGTDDCDMPHALLPVIA